MVRNGWLADVAAGGEVAGTDLGRTGQLADDRQAGGVGEGLEQPNIGVDDRRLGAWHAPKDIDHVQY